MKKLSKEQIELYLESQNAKDVMTILAYAIDKTPTETDNEIIGSIADYGELFAAKLSEVEEQDPTDKEAVNAALRIAQAIAEKTDTKWDDIVIGMASKITGANKGISK